FNRKGFQINRTGTYKYTLLAVNEKGIDSKTVEVTVLDCNHWCRSRGSITSCGQVTNEHDCSKSNITHNWKCIPTTTTKLDLSSSRIEKLPPGIFTNLSFMEKL
ncbi:unnamed protein product, partial [Porites evermanni]